MFKHQCRQFQRKCLQSNQRERKIEEEWWFLSGSPSACLTTMYKALWLYQKFFFYWKICHKYVLFVQFIQTVINLNKITHKWYFLGSVEKCLPSLQSNWCNLFTKTCPFLAMVVIIEISKYSSKYKKYMEHSKNILQKLNNFTLNMVIISRQSICITLKKGTCSKQGLCQDSEPATSWSSVGA